MPMWQSNYDKIIEVLKTENVIRAADRQAIVRDS